MNIKLNQQRFLQSIRSRAVKGQLTATERDRLQQIVVKNPCNADAHWLYIHACWAHTEPNWEDWEIAYSKTIDALKRNCDDELRIDVYILADTLYQYDDRDEDAFEMLRSAITEFPDNWRLLHNLIYVSLTLGKYSYRETGDFITELTSLKDSDIPLKLYSEGQLLARASIIYNSRDFAQKALAALENSIAAGLKQHHPRTYESAQKTIEELQTSK
jgi:tetratricopeptide (TPR) repeat protein